MGSISILAAAAMMLTTGVQDNGATLATEVEWTRDVKMVDEQPSASSVYSEDDKQPGVMLQCAGDTMSAIFAVEPIDFTTIDEVKTSRSRKWTGKLFIDGEMVDERDWIYLPAVKAAWSQSKLVAAKVFNAIVTGKSVEFELGSKGRFKVYLPQPDAAFSAFAQDCAAFREAAE